MNRLAFIVAALPLVLLVGCRGGWVKPLVRTEIVAETTTTNVVNGVPTIEVSRATNTVYLVNPSWTQAIETVRDVNSATNPTPSAPLVELGLGGLAAFLGYLARKKTLQASRLDQVLEAVVEGVEKAGHDDTKKAIEAEAQRRGVNPTLHRKVNP